MLHKVAFQGGNHNEKKSRMSLTQSGIIQGLTSLNSATYDNIL